MKFPLCVFADGVSLLTCGGGMGFFLPEQNEDCGWCPLVSISYWAVALWGYHFTVNMERRNDRSDPQTHMGHVCVVLR